MAFRFSTTPFYNTRQFYYGVERGAVESAIDIAVEHNHSPTKDQKLICGELDATTMSMGKYVTSKLVSDTDVVPVDPLAVAAGLTYREGNGMFVRTDAAFEDPADLAGARVGIHDTTLAMTYHKAILEERYDLAPDDIEWVVDTHQGLGERMEQGDLDAVERINDWYWGYREGEQYRLLYDMGQEWHAHFGYYPLVHLIAVDSTIYDEHPDRIEAFVSALQRSRSYRDEHYEHILESFLDERTDDGESTGEWEGERSVAALKRVTDGVDAPFELGDRQRQNVADWMTYADRYGVFTKPPIPDERLFPQ
jgi:ABC-type nitrate/sulfonate/bicarbonate transport system substrate-binding protein